MRTSYKAAAVAALLQAASPAWAINMSNCWIPANAPPGTLIGTVCSATTVGAAEAEGQPPSSVHYYANTPGIVQSGPTLSNGCAKIVTGVAYTPGIYSYQLFAVFQGGYQADPNRDFLLYVGVDY
jgi:hypothetical protein